MDFLLGNHHTSQKRKHVAHEIFYPVGVNTSDADGIVKSMMFFVNPVKLWHVDNAMNPIKEEIFQDKAQSDSEPKLKKRWHGFQILTRREKLNS